MSVSVNVGVKGSLGVFGGLCVMMFLWNPIESSCLLTSTNTPVADYFLVLDFAYRK